MQLVSLTTTEVDRPALSVGIRIGRYYNQRLSIYQGHAINEASVREPCWARDAAAIDGRCSIGERSSGQAWVD